MWLHISLLKWCSAVAVNAASETRNVFLRTCAAYRGVQVKRTPGGWGRNRLPLLEAALPVSAESSVAGRQHKSPWRSHHSAQRPEGTEWAKKRKKNNVYLRRWLIYKSTKVQNDKKAIWWDRFKLMWQMFKIMLSTPRGKCRWWVGVRLCWFSAEHQTLRCLWEYTIPRQRWTNQIEQQTKNWNIIKHIHVTYLDTS